MSDLHEGMRDALRGLLGATNPVNVTPRTRRNARIGKSTLTSHDLAMTVRERDEEIRENGPITERTPFGLWEYGRGGTSSTTYDVPPILIRSKRKYRRGL